jgi:hypothetical protein
MTVGTEPPVSSQRRPATARLSQPVGSIEKTMKAQSNWPIQGFPSQGTYRHGRRWQGLNAAARDLSASRRQAV